MREQKSSPNRSGEMPEKIILAALCMVLFAASAALYARDARPFADITIEDGAFRKTFTLAQVEERLKEARRVCVNTASAEEITVIPGIGPAIASRIVEYREKNGRFYRLEDLVEVRGIGPVKLESMREYVRIE